MRIRVEKILIKNNENLELEFETEFGRCRAVWVGEKPVLGNMYDVEIVIPSLLIWGDDILFCEQKIFQMKANDDTISLTGMVDSVEDTLFSLRLGKDSIFIEAEGMPFDEGIFVEVLIKKLIIYDCNT